MLYLSLSNEEFYVATRYLSYDISYFTSISTPPPPYHRTSLQQPHQLLQLTASPAAVKASPIPEEVLPGTDAFIDPPKPSEVRSEAMADPSYIFSSEAMLKPGTLV